MARKLGQEAVPVQREVHAVGGGSCRRVVRHAAEHGDVAHHPTWTDAGDHALACTAAPVELHLTLLDDERGVGGLACSEEVGSRVRDDGRSHRRERRKIRPRQGRVIRSPEAPRDPGEGLRCRAIEVIGVTVHKRALRSARTSPPELMMASENGSVPSSMR